MTDWSHDDFLVALAPAAFSKKRLAAAARDAERVIEMLAIPPGAAVLDLCCGPGRHALALAARGYRVTGVDLVEALISCARTAAAERGVDAEWIAADMRDFERPGGFDAALNLNSSFGFFQSDADILQVARQVRRSLRPGGLFLLETLGREILARNWRDRWWTEIDDELVIEERTVRPGWKYVDSRWITIANGQRREYTATQRVFSANEIRALLADADFDSVDIFGSLRGADYDDDARRLVAVARVGAGEV